MTGVWMFDGGTGGTLSPAAAVVEPADEQTGPPTSGAAEPPIIVTARRRPEPLAKTPLPVSVLPGRALVEQGVVHAEDLERLLPALTVQPNATGNLFFIRGVGNFTLQPNSDPAVGFALDGVFLARPVGTVGPFLDLDRVELAKGPQGVLYGRNAAAGSINLEVRQPVIGARGGTGFVELDDRGDARGETGVNLPTGAASALRLSTGFANDGGRLSGLRQGPQEIAFRGQWKVEWGRRSSLRLSTDWSRVGGVGIGTGYVGNYVLDRATGRYRFNPSGVPASASIYSPEGQAYRRSIFVPVVGRTLDAIGSTPGQDNRLAGVHARLDLDLGFGMLTAIPAKRWTTLDATVAGAPFGYRQRERDGQTSLEVRLTGDRAGWTWLAGTLLYDEHQDAGTVVNLSSALANSQQYYRTRSRAIFGHVTRTLVPGVRLSGGLRLTEDRKRFNSDTDALAIFCGRLVGGTLQCPTVPLLQLVDDFAALPFPVPPAGTPPLPIFVDGAPTGAIIAHGGSTAAGRLKKTALTWRGGLEVDVGPPGLLYAAAEKGSRPGGFNAAVGFETYKPEVLTAYTLGYRQRSSSGLWSLDLEAFWWNYRDQQVSSLRPDLSGTNANITDNIASSRIRGVEAELGLRPWRGGDVRLDVQYLDSRYRSFRYVNANPGVPPLTGCPATLDPASNVYLVDCAAFQPFNSPRWSITAGLRQQFTVGRAAVTAILNSRYRSSRNIGFAYLPEQHIGAGTNSDAQLVVGVPGTKLDLAAFVRNIEGKRTPEFMIYHPASNALVATTAAPRTFGLRATIAYR